ncbi:thioesterase family protein [Mycolicibacterium sp. P1-5]|uniref:thioesterase family protein n=1 Tax=Mycolicibacterium sp. P1-5 TaxID=2024617 RepID=UPI0011F02EF4|nr:thioesterase family protein [Mycolicibacterium sp. P1-5]KAA0111777.1 thioesterase family protein [Mycolicibacterium sp. P1-5]
MTGCYYRRLGTDGEAEVFASMDYTRSNWNSEIQHGSPPLALLTKAIEAKLADGMRIGRLTLDILGAIPITEMRVQARVDRPGNRIAMLSAEMSAERPDGPPRPVARVTAWALATSDTADAATDRYPPLIEGPTAPLELHWKDATGYIESVEWRPQYEQSAGANVYWMSPITNLVDNEPTTDLERLAMLVDSANGIGAAIDPQKFIYMNTDTAVHLHRQPSGNDFGVRARGSIGPDGIGVTTAELYDRDGFIGTSAQTLLVQRR